jgi:hypothetical protein
MSVELPEYDFRFDNSPSKVQGAERNQKTRLLKNTCPNDRSTGDRGALEEYSESARCHPSQLRPP